MKANVIRSLGLLWVLCWIGLQSAAVSASPQPGASCRVVSVVVDDLADSTTVDIVGDFDIGRYTAETVVAPPRIVIDVFCAAASLETLRVPVGNALLHEVRVGYHRDKIRLVLDLSGKPSSRFSIRTRNRQMQVFLQPGAASQRTDRPRPAPAPPAPAAGGAGKSLPDGNGNAPISGEKEALLQLPADDGRPDTRQLIAGITAMGKGDWPQALDVLRRLLAETATGRYAEQAHFLLARALDRTNPAPDAKGFNRIVDAYRAAIRQFPDSPFAPQALIHLGDLHLQRQYDNEALGYYNLVLNQADDLLVPTQALARKARILHRKGRRAELLTILPVLSERVAKLPPGPEVDAISIELAKLYYDINGFHRSLDILAALVKRDEDLVYQHPEIPLYMGYNRFQLGEFAPARQRFFFYHNCFPGSADNHLVLAQIGDSYREEGLLAAAGKIYRLVTERYPKTEGAYISMLRLAEMLENETEANGGGSKPRILYQNIIFQLQEEDPANPLIQLAMLKLSFFHQRRGDHLECMNTVQMLLTSYPWVTLAEEIRNGLRQLMIAMLEDDMEAGRYDRVYQFYRSENDLFLKMKSPQALLVVARALIQLGLEEAAIGIYRMAERLLSDHDEPPDLIFYTARDCYQQKQYQTAIKKIDQLSVEFPDHAMTLQGLCLKSDILHRQERFDEAARVSGSLLDGPLDACGKVHVLVAQVQALMAAKRPLAAYGALTHSEAVLAACEAPGIDAYLQVGDLYLDLEQPWEAEDYYEKAESLAKDTDEKNRLVYKRAMCRVAAGRRPEALALLQRLMESGEGFWPKLAGEAAAQMEFEGTLLGLMKPSQGTQFNEDGNEKSSAGSK